MMPPNFLPSFPAFQSLDTRSGRHKVTELDIRETIGDNAATARAWRFLAQFVSSTFGYSFPLAPSDKEFEKARHSKRSKPQVSFDRPIQYSGLEGMSDRDAAHGQVSFALENLEILLFLADSNELRSIVQRFDKDMTIQSSEFNRRTRQDRSWRLVCRFSGRNAGRVVKTRRRTEITKCPTAMTLTIKRLTEVECTTKRLSTTFSPHLINQQTLDAAYHSLESNLQFQIQRTIPQSLIPPQLDGIMPPVFLQSHYHMLLVSAAAKMNEDALNVVDGLEGGKQVVKKKKKKRRKARKSRDIDDEEEEEDMNDDLVEDDEEDDSIVPIIINPPMINLNLRPPQVDVYSRGLSISTAGWYILTFKNLLIDHNHYEGILPAGHLINNPGLSYVSSSMHQQLMPDGMQFSAGLGYMQLSSSSSSSSRPLPMTSSLGLTQTDQEKLIFITVLRNVLGPESPLMDSDWNGLMLNCSDSAQVLASVVSGFRLSDDCKMRLEEFANMVSNSSALLLNDDMVRSLEGSNDLLGMSGHVAGDEVGEKRKAKDQGEGVPKLKKI